MRRCVLADRDSLLHQLRAAFAAPTRTPIESMPARHQNWISESKERFVAVQTESYGGIDANPLTHGTWMAAYSMEARNSQLRQREFRDRLRRCEGGETGWPIGLFLDGNDKRPYLAGGAIENWLGGGKAAAAHADFWRASPAGHFVTSRGYADDEIVQERRPAGSCMDFLIFVWRVGEVLLHAMRFASEFADEGAPVEVTIEWSGLKGRRLTNTTSRDDVVRAAVHVDAAATIGANLSELVGQITRPLYEAFDFFELSKQIRDAELDRLRNRR